MGRVRVLTEKDKEIIGYLYNNRNLSIGKIANVVGCSSRTVFKYKDYGKK